MQNAARGYFSRQLHPLREGRVLLVAAGLCLTLGFMALQLFPPSLIRQADLRLYDQMLAARSTAPRSGVPILVGIDDASLAAYGQWPWPRYRLAMLVERLQQNGAAVIALDFLMPEADRSSPEIIQHERRRDGIETAAPTGPQRDSNTERLASTLAKGRTVLGYYLDFSRNAATTARTAVPPLPAASVLVAAPGSTAGWPRPSGAIRTIAPLGAAASAEGFTNAVHDIDGTLRRVPLLLPGNGGMHASLALDSMLLAAADRSLTLVKQDDETRLLWNGRRIPLDRGGNLLVDFRSPSPPFPYLSAQTVLKTAAVPGSMKDRIVLVGAWARGLGDAHLVPSGRTLQGAEVHANIIDTVLAGRFIARPGWADGAELVFIGLMGAFSTLFLSRAGVAWSLLSVPAGTLGGYAIGRELLVGAGLHVSPLLPILALITITSVLGLLKYGIEARKVAQRTQDLIEAQDTVIVSMSVLAEARDKDTGRHILRTQRYVEILARQLSRLPKYAELDEASIELLAKSAPLHDIGKVGIPDSILQKPGRLTDAEYAIMKTHPLIGAEALSRILGGSRHPEKHEFLTCARQMVLSHHERWDGSGYPLGLRGDAIPLAGRLMALADVYDALISKRIYKPGFSSDEVRAFILKNSGIHFDPDIVSAFLARSEAFLEVSRQFADAATADPDASKEKPDFDSLLESEQIARKP